MQPDFEEATAATRSSADRDWAAQLELLERHRPVLRFDPQYDYRLLAASSAVENPGNILRRAGGEVIARAAGMPPLDLATLSAYPAGLDAREADFIGMAPDHVGDARRMEWEPEHRGRIYGRVVDAGDETWLQYWFWLYYNPKNLLGVGKHEGDWEMIQVGLGPDGEPAAATYAQHDSGEARRWGEVEAFPADRRRPVVYVAPLSHASYFDPGTHPYIPGIDHPYGGGPEASELEVVPFGPWAEWPGRWGSVENRIARKAGGGPPSPGLQGPKWSDPGGWHARMRRRAFRGWVGRALHAAGARTYPAAPEITAAAFEGGRVRVAWRRAGSGFRAGRHLQVTVHEGHFVIAGDVVVDAAATGETTLGVPEGRRPTAVMASAYNRIRQRSEIAELGLDPSLAGRPAAE